MGDELGFFASSLSAPLPDLSRQAFWDAAKGVHGTLKKSIAETNLFRMLIANSVHPTLLDAMYFQKYGLSNEPLAGKLLRKTRWHNNVDNLTYQDKEERYSIDAEMLREDESHRETSRSRDVATRRGGRGRDCGRSISARSGNTVGSSDDSKADSKSRERRER